MIEAKRIKPVGNRVFLSPDLEGLSPLAKGISDGYELTGVPRTPAYCRVTEVGPGTDFERAPRVERGEMVFFDLAHVSVEAKVNGQRTFIVGGQHVRAVIDSIHARPRPVGDFILIETVSSETLRNIAPELLAAFGSEFVLPDSILEMGLASDATESTKQRKVLTHLFGRIAACADGTFVGKNWRAHDGRVVGGVGLCSGIRAMPISWHEGDEPKNGHLLPWSDLLGCSTP